MAVVLLGCWVIELLCALSLALFLCFALVLTGVVVLFTEMTAGVACWLVAFLAFAACFAWLVALMVG